MVRMPQEGDHVRKQPLGSSGYAKEQWKPVDYLATSTMSQRETQTDWKWISWEFVETSHGRKITAAVKWRNQDYRGSRQEAWLIEIAEDNNDSPEIGFYCSFTIDEPFESDRAFTVAEGIVSNVSHWPTGSIGHHGHVRPPKPEPEPEPIPPVALVIRGRITEDYEAIPDPPGTPKELDPTLPIYLKDAGTKIWHEVIVILSPGQVWECIHCHLKYVQGTKTNKRDADGVHCGELAGEEE